MREGGVGRWTDSWGKKNQRGGRQAANETLRMFRGVESKFCDLERNLKCFFPSGPIQ